MDRESEVHNADAVFKIIPFNSSIACSGDNSDDGPSSIEKSTSIPVESTGDNLSTCILFLFIPIITAISPRNVLVQVFLSFDPIYPIVK